MPTPTPKAKPGAYRGEVLLALASQTEPVTPVQLAKVMNRTNTGAVANALLRLTKAGEALQVCNKPRRYTRAEGSSERPVAQTAVPTKATASIVPKATRTPRAPAKRSRAAKAARTPKATAEARKAS